MLIGIHGKARSGKDSIAKWLGRERSAFHTSFALPIKQALIGMFSEVGLTWAHFEDEELKEAPLGDLGVSPRQLAQALGTEFGRDCVHQNIWVMKVELYLKSCRVWDGPRRSIVLSDARFENEAAWLRSNGGLVLHVERPGADGKVGISGHRSESGIIPATGDILVRNDGTLEQLYAKLEEIFPQRAAA